MLALIVFVIAAVLRLVWVGARDPWFWLFAGLAAACVSLPVGPTWVRH